MSKEDFMILLAGVIAILFSCFIVGFIFFLGYQAGRVDAHLKKFETIGTPFKDEAFIKTQFQQYVQ